MKEWEDTPLPTDKEQLRKLFENKICVYADQASVAKTFKKERAVERLLDVVLEMAQHQVAPSTEVFQSIGGQRSGKEYIALVFVAASRLIEIHKSESTGPLHSNKLQAIHVVSERLIYKAREVLEVL